MENFKKELFKMAKERVIDAERKMKSIQAEIIHVKARHKHNALQSALRSYEVVYELNLDIVNNLKDQFEF